MRKGKVLSLLLTALALSFVSCQSGQTANPYGPSDISLETQKSWTPEQGYKHLLEIKSLAFGGVGFAGVTSDGEFAFRAVLKSPDAVNLFKAACSEATDEGKLYALCGLRAVDRNAFNYCVVDLRKKGGSVMTTSGCTMSQERLRTVVQRIVNGDYDSYFAAR